jgi:Na+/melibiose symporter and related transporters
MSRSSGGAWRRYASYTAINFGFSLLGMTATMLLMYYYTDVLMLPALSVSAVLFTARLFDGLIDPFLGHYMDGRTTKLGKYRGYVIYWAIPACLAFALMFSPAPVDGAGKAVWCLLLYLLFTLSFSFVEIASLPLLASFGSREQRAAGNALKVTGCILAVLTVAVFAVPLVRMLGNGSEQTGYARMAALFAGVVLAALLLGGFGFREGDYAADGGERLSAGEAIRAVLREKSIAFLLCMHLCLDAASAFKMQAGIYYLKYNLARQDLTSLFLTSSIAASLLAQPLVYHCSRRFPQRVLMVYGFVLSAAAMLAIGMSGGSVALLIAANCAFGVASAFPASLVFAYMVDLSEQLGRKRGKPFGGVANAFIGMASRVGGSLASTLLSLILFATAYRPNEAQSARTLTGISIGFVVLPILVLILGAVFASLSFRTYEAERSLSQSADLFAGEAET